MTKTTKEEHLRQREIKTENQRLRRENSRLKRELEKRLSSVPSTSDKTAGRIRTVPVNMSTCPKCSSSDLKTLMTPAGKKLTVCGGCSERYREKSVPNKKEGYDAGNSE